MPKAILISVGGSLNPIIYTLNQQKPEYIIFFASQQSQEQIPQILKQIEFTPKKVEQIITPSAEDLNECYKTIKENLSDILNRLALTPEDIIVDYTGGTKTMSVAAALATIDFCNMYIYIGGVERDKRGLGIVIDGQEKMVYNKNPWEALATEEIKKVNLYFNSVRFAQAIELLEKIISKVKESKMFFENILTLVKGYYLWDGFFYKDAKSTLKSCIKNLGLYAEASKDCNIRNLVFTVNDNLNFLNKIIKNENLNLFFIKDLIANARRRGDIEHKYDDATQRLYSAVEKIAQYYLKKEYDIDNSNIDLSKDLSKIPSELHEEYKKRENNGIVRLGLKPSYVLLAKLGHEIGRRCIENSKIMKILEKRNRAPLAHGTTPIDEQLYQEFFSEVINFSGIKEEELPEFPKLNL